MTGIVPGKEAKKDEIGLMMLGKSTTEPIDLMKTENMEGGKNE